MASGATQTPVVAFSNPQATAPKPQETCGSWGYLRKANVRLEKRLEQRWEPADEILWSAHSPVQPSRLRKNCGKLMFPGSRVGSERGVAG